MADDTRVARRYAAALFSIALRENSIDATLAEVTMIGRFISEVPYLRAVLYQPLISDAQKRKIINDAFGKRLSATTLNFLLLLVRKRREMLTETVIADFQRLVDEHLGKVVATVSSATPLSARQLDTLSKSLAARTGKNVEISSTVDPDLIGGLLIRLGDNVIDGTVRTRLESLRRQLLAVQ